jgi:predicted enzyme related to lactoylglutathione lyase
MEGVTISDAGSSLVITAREKAAVEAAVSELVSRGAAIIAPPAQLGSKWVASCAKPADGGGQALGEDATRAVAGNALLQGVKITAAGGNLMITGADRPTVHAAFAELVKRGARAISEPVPLGNKWVATCSDPEDNRAPCTVEALGLQLVVSGASREAVEDKVKELQAAGARLVAPPSQSGPGWMAICDRGGMQGVMIVR